MVLAAEKCSTLDFYKAVEVIQQRTMGQTHDETQTPRQHSGRLSERRTTEGNSLSVESPSGHDL